jgi:RimJ/RimL family protein N-acetyltransferase
MRDASHRTVRRRTPVSAFAPLLSPLPERVATARLLLRCWQPADAALLKDAIDASLPELRAWMPWALDEPSPLEVLEERLRGFRDDFRAGHDWAYGIFDPGEARVLGGVGLHPRVGPATEIGYWIRTAAARLGYATEAAGALTAIAFEFAPVSRVEIRCDPRNRPSAAIPRRLGYRHTDTLVGDALAPGGAPRDTMVWTLTPAEYAARAARERGIDA